MSDTDGFSGRTGQGPTMLAGQCPYSGHRRADIGKCELDGLDTWPTMHGCVVSVHTDPVPHLHEHMAAVNIFHCLDWLWITREIGYGEPFRLAEHYRGVITIIDRGREDALLEDRISWR